MIEVVKGSRVMRNRCQFGTGYIRLERPRLGEFGLLTLGTNKPPFSYGVTKPATDSVANNPAGRRHAGTSPRRGGYRPPLGAGVVISFRLDYVLRGGTTGSEPFALKIKTSQQTPIVSSWKVSCHVAGPWGSLRQMTNGENPWDEAGQLRDTLSIV